jgi:MbtH protein
LNGTALNKYAMNCDSGEVLTREREVAMRTVSFDFDSPEARFKVLINHEEQYSLWPADLEVPGGWTETGVCASKEECDKYLESTWTDMRPKSLRIALDGE